MKPSYRRVAATAAVLIAAGVLPTLAASTSSAAPAVDDDGPFARIGQPSLSAAQARVRPKEYAAVKVDLAQVRNDLAAAPGARRADGGLEFSVPTPAGTSERFEVHRTQVMEDKLAGQHPELATYAGRSLDHRGTSIALDVTPMGFHASVRGPRGQRAWYVDPAYNKRGTATHLSYYGGSVPEQVADFAEKQAPEVKQAMARREKAAQGRERAGGGLVTQRLYRLALVTDPSYASYFGTENVLAEKVTLINRVNQIYNDDLAVQLRLINQTDDLNLDTDAEATGANGPCGSHPCFDPPGDDPDTEPGMLDFCDVPGLVRIRTVLSQIVGASNYDIGHLGLGVDGGGIANLGVVGGDWKAQGCTGLPEPQGDFYAIDYVAHEMGHQFAGNHTFNGTQRACSTSNRNGPTSVEPGSGSSVMAYAGICASDNLQPHTDPYFSERSRDEINDYIGGEFGPFPEVQTVSLRRFDTDGETITLDFPGATTGPVTLTRGTDYDADGVEAAVESLTGKDVTIAEWGYDPQVAATYPAPVQPIDDAGFQVIFAGDPDPFTTDSDFADEDNLLVSSTSRGVSGFTGETTKGGPGNNGGYATVATRNHAPVVSAGADRTIPLRTPFKLTGSATDADQDDLVYLWEQDDSGDPTINGGTGLVDNRKLDGPLFRVFGTYANVTDEGTLESPSPGENIADGNPSRVFPDLAQVLAGNTNAANGRCPTVSPTATTVPPAARDCYSEFLPIRGYVGTFGSTTPAMHFRLTVPDGYPNGGGVGYDEVRLRVSQTAGPFRVTSQDGGSVRRGSTQTVRWSVNGTQPLAARVKVLLSVNGGRTFGRVLSASTANDGSVQVRMPRISTTKARIMVKPVDNYFLSVNPRAFTIR